ncbi:MAG: leucine-rich repeat domain-containing protein, partial [Prevotella sp.]|nr:leucine-rich repeat domain-containing protein [Prevotella sp.]
SLDANNENIGFYYQNDDGSSVVNGAHKAYLRIATAQAKVCYMLSDEDVATAIESAPATEKYDGIVYDLQGRRVATPTKGLYIVNGRKVVVK